MIECIETGCNREATHILVNYNHKIIKGGEKYCQLHAFMDGKEKCSCCDNYGIEVEDKNSGEMVELLPTYQAGALNSDGCCSEHP